jgi:hypothetical protein
MNLDENIVIVYGSMTIFTSKSNRDVIKIGTSFLQTC